MNSDTTIVNDSRTQLDKQMLALNALTNLAKRFSQKPDFGNLIDTALLALTGQFSTVGAFCILASSDGLKGQRLFYATGRFRGNNLLKSVQISEEHNDYFREYPQAVIVDQVDIDGSLSNLLFIISECSGKLIIPLLHETKVIGIIGLGSKVTKKEFDQSDRELLAAIINTITPLIINSLLFYEISALSSWYLQILNNVKQGVFVFDRDHNLNKINRPGFDILKAFIQQLKTINMIRNVPLKLVFSEESFPGWVRKFEAMSNNKYGTYLEKMKAKNDAGERLYNVGVSTISDKSDTLTDLIITLDDVTDQEKNEQRLFELEKFAEKGVMASSISHELNNFLGLLMGGVELSQNALGKGNSEKAQETLEKLKDNIDKMERFTTGLMDYARLETCKETGNLNTIINDVLSFVGPQKRFHSIAVKTDLSPSLPAFLMDGDQMAQLLLNLLNNAADAIHEAKPKSPQITIRTVCENECVCLSVADNGLGIKSDIKDQLFNFHLTTKPDGHGYGLVTCGKIIKNHHGNITVDSVEGRGTTFTFRFPTEHNP